MVEIIGDRPLPCVFFFPPSHFSDLNSMFSSTYSFHPSNPIPDVSNTPGMFLSWALVFVGIVSVILYWMEWNPLPQIPA